MQTIKLKGLNNVRDIGGISINGKTLKYNLFIRGKSLYTATASDVKVLVSHGIRKIIDLRTDMEASRKPDVEIKGVSYCHIPIFNREVPGITSHKRNDAIDLTKIYAGMLKEEYLDNISKIIKEIINTDGCVYFHCSEGKDRTGIISMILLLLLGAKKEDILEDYLYTNVTNNYLSKKYYLFTLISTGSKDKASNIRSFYLAKEEYVEAAFEVISEKYNNIEDFAFIGLKLTKQELIDFRNKCLQN